MGEITDGDPLFPGDSEIDQLFQIQKVVGRLTPDQEEQFATNPRFIGLKFPELKSPETLEKHYVGKMAKNAIDLMNGMLRMDPRSRLTSIQALSHNYFDTVRDAEVEDLIANHKEKKAKLIEISKQHNEMSRSKDLSKRKTSTEKYPLKAKKNPYVLPLGTSPPQIRKKKGSSKFYKDKKGSNSIKNLRHGRSSSKELSNKRNQAMNSYDSNAYPGQPRNKRNIGTNESLRENQSMSNYIPSSFNGLYVQNLKTTVQEKTEYDYEIGGEFSKKGIIAASSKLDHSIGRPSQVYGAGELKKSTSSSISGILSKQPLKNHKEFTHESNRRIPSLSPSGRSEESKKGFRSYNTSMINKVVKQKKKKKIRQLFENLSNDVNQQDNINATIPSRHEQKYSYYEEEKSQRTLRGNSKPKKRSSVRTRENTERRAIHKYKQKQPKQSLKDRHQMSIIEFNNSRLGNGNEYNYAIPDSKDTSQINSEDYHNSSAQYPFL